MTLPDEISVRDLKQMHDDDRHFVLLDVREDDELAIACLDFAKHVPMRTIPARIGELAQDDDIVVLCHSGGRSGRVAQYLRERGFRSVANLAGGIDAWSHDVDSTIPTY